MFGDYLYGIEILELPTPMAHFTSEIAITDKVPQWREASNVECDPLQLYWFRWITGHQTMFMLWHILTKELAHMESTGVDAERLALTTKILNACGVLYEYSGSCSVKYYHQYVRPLMTLTHRAFSGYWALDYSDIPRLTRCVLLRTGLSANVEKKQKAFKQSYLRGQKIHINVAKKLVPENVSLLKLAKNNGMAIEQVQPHHYKIYDAFFLVNRTNMSPLQFQQSLYRRLDAIVDDLTTCPPSNQVKQVSVETLVTVKDSIRELFKIRPKAPSQDLTLHKLS